jgi:hypothetical protein
VRESGHFGGAVREPGAGSSGMVKQEQAGTISVQAIPYMGYDMFSNPKRSYSELVLPHACIRQ